MYPMDILEDVSVLCINHLYNPDLFFFRALQWSVSTRRSFTSQGCHLFSYGESSSVFVSSKNLMHPSRRLQGSPVRITVTLSFAKKHKRPFIEAIIVLDRTCETSWSWKSGRKFCQETVGTDYFSINTRGKSLRLEAMAIDENVKMRRFVFEVRRSVSRHASYLCPPQKTGGRKIPKRGGNAASKTNRLHAPQTEMKGHQNRQKDMCGTP